MGAAVFFIAQAAAGPSKRHSSTAKKTVGESSQVKEEENVSESSDGMGGGGVAGTKNSSSHTQIPILTYHNVSYYSGKDATSLQLHTSPVKFSQQMKYLSENGYSVISLSDAYGILFGNKKSPSKPVVLTFGDGYSDFYKNAFPILRSYKFTATVFVITQKPGEGGFLSWTQLKKVANAGFEIGSQSVTNANLTKINSSRSVQEVSISKEDINGEIGNKVKYLAFPYGSYNSAVLKNIAKAGYSGGLTLAGVDASDSQSPFSVSRKVVDGRFSLNDFAALLK